MGSESSTYKDEQKRFEAERFEEIQALATLENLIKEAIVKVSSRPLDMPGERGEGSRGYATGIVDALNDMGAERCRCDVCNKSREISRLLSKVRQLEEILESRRQTIKRIQDKETMAYRVISRRMEELDYEGKKKNAALYGELAAIRALL